MRELRRLLGYLGPYRRDLLIAAVMIILETAFEMVIPVLMADIIDVGVANRDVAVILQRGIQMGVCALLALATGLLYARFTARAAYGWGANIREAQFERVQKYAFSNLDKFETSSLVTRMTTDVTVLQNTVNGGYRPLVRSPVMLVMGVGLSFWMNPRLALVFLVCAPVLGGVLFVIVRRVAPMYGRLQKAVDRLNNVVQEGLTAIRAVKAFVRGEYEEEKFQGVNSELMETSQRTFRLAVLNLPVFQLVMYTAVVLIMWLGGNMVLNSGLQVGQLTGFLSYVLQVMNSMMLISNVFLLLTRSLASARRISEVLDENIVLDSKKTYSNRFHTSGGNEAYSVMANTLRGIYGTDVLIATGNSFTGNVLKAGYTEKMAGNMIMPNELSAYSSEMSGAELKETVRNFVEGYQGGFIPFNRGSLPVFSGISVEIRETDNGYTLSKVSKNGKQIQDKDTFTVTCLAAPQYMEAYPAEENIVFDGGDTSVEDTWTTYVSDGNAILAEPEDYITLR